VVAVDLKGYGESEKPMWRGKYKIEEVVTELAEFIVAVGTVLIPSNATTILNFSIISGGGQKCVLVGHDLGALIGWFLVYSHPDLISKFVSISCPHPNIYWDELQPTAFVNKM
jgi:epoxide hydrolase 4